MRRKFFSQTRVAAVWFMALCAGSSIEAQPTYFYRTIDFPNTISFQAVGINNAGQIAGYYEDTSFMGHGFLLNSGSVCNPGTINCSIIDPPGALGTTVVTGINSPGHVVGYYQTPDPVVDTGFLFSQGSFTPIAFPGAVTTLPASVNDADEIAGIYRLAQFNSPIQGFLLSKGSFSTINICLSFPALQKQHTILTGINNAGEIVGYCTNGDDTPQGFLLSGGNITFIGIKPLGINVGNQILASNFVLLSGTNCDTAAHNCAPIACPGASGTVALGINDKGQVVGGCFIPSGSNSGPHGFVATPGCPVDGLVDLEFGTTIGPYMMATFNAPAGKTLKDYATDCKFTNFNFQQKITSLPCGTQNKPTPAAALLLPALNLCKDGSLQAPPSFFDPPQGGYSYFKPGQEDPYPFTIPSHSFTQGSQCYYGDCLHFPPVVSPCNNVVDCSDATSLFFVDGPNDPTFSGAPPSPMPSGRFIAFSTSLVGVGPGVDQAGNPVATPLKTWTWNSTFNGSSTGGISQTFGIFPIVPGSGTGGVTITSINEVPLALVPSTQVSTTASGLAYSRVSQTFNGIVTITNISNSTTSAPSNGFFQILFTTLPAGVTLANAGGMFNGSPFITVPAVTSLSPGQSASVAVQFKNPANAKINFLPVIYSGSLN